MGFLWEIKCDFCRISVGLSEGLEEFLWVHLRNMCWNGCRSPTQICVGISEGFLMEFVQDFYRISCLIAVGYSAGFPQKFPQN